VIRRKYADSDGGIDDDELETLITDKLDSDPVFWESRKSRKTMIVVEVDGGYATLNGIVKSQVERRRADILARALGALGVDNRLRLEAEIQEPHS
jgi:osmotically-inducible protein OsmY